MIRAIFTAFAVICLGGVVAAACVAWDWTTHRVTVRNEGSTAMTDVEIVLEDASAKHVANRRIANLQPGDSISCYFTYNDPVGTLRFSRGGKVREEPVMMDLWTGEDWLLAVNERGEVESSYDD